MQASANRPDGAVRAMLLQYYAAPGKYQLALRQPALLFSSIRDVLLIAAESRDGETSRQGAEIRAAAHFFIRAAMLFPGADHYTLFGLPAKTVPADLKERYRLLMRLIHPDSQESRANLWPVDAAIRVNRAYEVLSSAVLRREYDEQLTGVPQRPATEFKAKPKPHAHKAKPHAPAFPLAQRRPRRLSRRVAWSIVALLALLAGILLIPHGEPVRIVQKSATRAAYPAVFPPAPAVRAELASEAHAARPSAAAIPPGAPEPARAMQQAAAAPAVAGPGAAQAPLLMQPVLREPPTAPQPRPIPTTTELRPAVLVEASPPRGRSRAEAPLSPAAVPLAALAQAAPPVTVAIAAPTPVPPHATSPAAPSAEGTPHASAVAAALPPTPRAPADGLASPPMAAVVRAPAAMLPRGPAPNMLQAQPVLSELLVALEAGDSAQLLRLLEPEARAAAGAQAFTRRYDEAVRGGRPVRLSQADFRGESREGVLHVTGKLRLHAGETPVGFAGERLVLRAEFISRGGKIILTGLSSGTD